MGRRKGGIPGADVRAIASEIKGDPIPSSARSDNDIARSALKSLQWNVLLPDTLKVQVTDGRVTIEGTVEWQNQKTEAERTVWALTGVRGVANAIALDPTFSPDGVKLKIEDALKRSASIDARHITVEASRGRMTLTRKVKSWVQRDEAERATWSAPGVTYVEDPITIK